MAVQALADKTCKSIRRFYKKSRSRTNRAAGFFAVSGIKSIGSEVL